MKKRLLSVCAAAFLCLILLPATARAASADGGVYAILYTDDTLVFQHGDTPNPEKTVSQTYPVDLDAVYDNTKFFSPWYAARKSARVVSFADTIRPTSTAFWFYFFENLERVENIQNLDTSNVTNMNSMFDACSKLKELDVSHFDTANVTNMSFVFNYCIALKGLDVSGWDTSNVTNMHAMFDQCRALTTLDVSHFDTGKVWILAAMFRDCHNLTALDVSHFDTARAQNISSMFEGCYSLTELDLSHFDTAKLKYASDMFLDCKKLKTIYASDKFKNVPYSEKMFQNCLALVGGAGTKYDKSHMDWRYARIDATSAPGYFTEKPFVPFTHKITAVTPDKGGEKLSVEFVSPFFVTVAVSYFDSDGHFVSADIRAVKPDVGSVAFPWKDARTARVMLLKTDFSPLCEAVSVSLEL